MSLMLKGVAFLKNETIGERRKEKNSGCCFSESHCTLPVANFLVLHIGEPIKKRCCHKRTSLMAACMLPA